MTGYPYNLRWNDERSADLKEMWAQGKSASQIGLVLGVSRNAVIGRVHRMDLPHRKPTGPNGGRLPVKPRERVRRHKLRRTPNPKQFIWETGEPPTEQVHELLGPPVSLMELKGIDPLAADYDCRWSVGTEFCGLQHVEGYPYCKTHCRLAYRRAPNVSELERVAQAFRQRKRNAAFALRRAA